jgi:hypothetical protein
MSEVNSLRAQHPKKLDDSRAVIAGRVPLEALPSHANRQLVTEVEDLIDELGKQSQNIMLVGFIKVDRRALFVTVMWAVLSAVLRIGVTKMFASGV